MNIDQLTNYIWNRNVLYTVLLELTYRCNLDCVFCYNDTNRSGKSLSFDQYQKLLHDLEELGVMHLTLSGGEPLAHPDFFRIGVAARELGFAVRIKSNGHALNERMVSRIQQEIDPFGLDISLHGACAQTHDRQTRVPGSFDKLIKNLEILKDIGMRYQLNTPVTIWNEHELDEMCEIADRFGVDIEFDGDITPKDDGDRSPVTLATSHVTQQKILQIKRERIHRKLSKKSGLGDSQATTAEVSSQGGLPNKMADNLLPVSEDSQLQKKQCGAGSSTVTIDPYGAVYPCTQWRQPVGDLHEQSIIEIWTESPGLRKVRTQLIDLKKLNEERGYANNVGFCAARANQETGSPTKLYPLVSMRAALQEKLRQQ